VTSSDGGWAPEGEVVFYGQRLGGSVEEACKLVTGVLHHGAGFGELLGPALLVVALRFGFVVGIENPSLTDFVRFVFVVVVVARRSLVARGTCFTVSSWLVLLLEGGLAVLGVNEFLAHGVLLGYKLYLLLLRERCEEVLDDVKVLVIDEQEIGDRDHVARHDDCRLSVLMLGEVEGRSSLEGMPAVIRRFGSSRWW
jgi:hypothetical protein